MIVNAIGIEIGTHIEIIIGSALKCDSNMSNSNSISVSNSNSIFSRKASQ